MTKGKKNVDETRLENITKYSEKDICMVCNKYVETVT